MSVAPQYQVIGGGSEPVARFPLPARHKKTAPDVPPNIGRYFFDQIFP
ncbi:MAG: hypothetical protein RIB43_03245 [Rhodospirillaceae bacterium]